MSPEEKLSKNHYRINPHQPHIVLADHPDRRQLSTLVAACPAGLYQQNSDGSLSFDLHGCLECGTCRLLCDEKVLARWQYPSSGYGIVLRFG
ncbi:ferredoxin family protein [Budvicia diplopodorum]|uniref:ferredoxin family protein n=1 Tax=Budvicia diplopodorum TaxID=1119056 RepID=UPI001359D279|nr:ferredoxin family protein [Budvicia diplopodorum]